MFLSSRVTGAKMELKLGCKQNISTRIMVAMKVTSAVSCDSNFKRPLLSILEFQEHKTTKSRNLLCAKSRILRHYALAVPILFVTFHNTRTSDEGGPRVIDARRFKKAGCQAINAMTIGARR